MLVVYGISYFGSLYIYRTPRTRCLQNVNSNSPPYTRAVLGADSSLIIFVVPDSEIVAVMFGLVAYIAPTSGATKKLTGEELFVPIVIPVKTRSDVHLSVSRLTVV
jgi:hypothetical protein